MIRQALEKDIPEMMSLLHQVCDVHAKGRPDLFNAGHTKYSEDELQAILKDENKPIFAFCDENDMMLGYAFCVIKTSDGTGAEAAIKTLYIDDLCIDENCRGQHIGSKLYEAVKEYAKNNGFYNITLNVWECNPSAKKFYESLGMKVQKTGMEEIL